VTVTFVAPAGTTKLCDAPVYPSVTVPVHLPAPHAHIPPVGQLVTQSVQTPPVPHAIAVVPAAQVPFFAAEQQPPLHACVEVQAVVHACVVVSQACPTGQSFVELQQPGPGVQPASDVESPLAASPGLVSGCGASEVLPSLAVTSSPPSEDAVASSELASPARIGSPMPAIAAHPADASAQPRITVSRSL